MGDGPDLQDICTLCGRESRLLWNGVVVCSFCSDDIELRAREKAAEQRKLKKRRAGVQPSRKETVNIRSLDRGSWVWLPKQLVRNAKAVGHAGILVYAYLALFTSKGIEQAFPAQQTMARGLCMSKSTVRRALRRLGAAGYVKWERRTGHHRSGRMLYTLTDPS